MCPSKIHMLRPYPKDNSMWRWGFGRCLSYKATALVDGISAIIKEAPESSLAPSTK